MYTNCVHFLKYSIILNFQAAVDLYSQYVSYML